MSPEIVMFILRSLSLSLFYTVDFVPIFLSWHPFWVDRERPKLPRSSGPRLTTSVVPFFSSPKRGSRWSSLCWDYCGTIIGLFGHTRRLEVLVSYYLHVTKFGDWNTIKRCRRDSLIISPWSFSRRHYFLRDGRTWTDVYTWNLGKKENSIFIEKSGY